MVSLDSLLLPAGCLLAAAVLTGAFRHHALRTGVLDVPNSRSSHSRPTPRGGGLAIVLAVFASIGYLWLIEAALEPALGIAVLVSGSMVASIGYVDDRVGLSPAPRVMTHTVAAAIAVYALGPGQLASAILPDVPSALTITLMVLAVVWTTNLFNFMDGIDGIAAMEAAFVTGSAALLIWMQGTTVDLVPLLLAVAAASLGFLFWNWAPARIFMGDAGSGFLGFVLAAFALASHAQGSISVWTWIALMSLFLGDATVTLLRRVLRGERWYSAHRSHAYQHLAQRWSSHSRVSLLFAAVNLFAVLPLAWWSVVTPGLSLPIAVASVVTAGCAALACGAGRSNVAASIDTC